jgi:TPR repeat protein
MENNFNLDKFTDILAKYSIRISKKDKFSKKVGDEIIGNKLIDLYEKDIIDDKCTENLYLKYLGMYYEYKIKDYDKMEDIYFVLLNRGDIDAMLRLGDFYRDTEPDFEEMKRFYMMVFKKGKSEGMMRLHEYFKKKGNKLYANKCYQKALNMIDKDDYSIDVDELVKKGYHYQFTEKNYDEMKRYYEIAIKRESSMAMNNLGVYYGTILFDHCNAENYYKMAIEKGLPLAMRNLAHMYKRSGNHEEMEKYFQMAIAKGDEEAMFELGNFYENSVPEIAQQYYRMASEKGHKKAEKKIKNIEHQYV